MAPIQTKLTNILGMCARLSKADGAVTAEELEILEDFMNKTLNMPPAVQDKAVKVFEQARHSERPFEHYAQALYNEVSDDRRLLTGVIELLIMIAASDRNLSAEEEILITAAKVVFEMDEGSGSQYEPAEPAEDEEKHALDILGLTAADIPDGVKPAYRRLVRLYHPDKVAHLGPRLIETAEEMMKEINAAYLYFKNRYSL